LTRMNIRAKRGIRICCLGESGDAKRIRSGLNGDTKRTVNGRLEPRVSRQVGISWRYGKNNAARIVPDMKDI